MNRVKFDLAGLTFLLICGLVLTGCRTAPELPAEPMPTEDETVPTGEKQTAVVEVVMQGNAFQPDQITLPAGTTVTWINADAVEHTVTAGSRGSAIGMFDETVPPGETFSFSFEETGTYAYHCTIHPGMDGTVIVE